MQVGAKQLESARSSVASICSGLAFIVGAAIAYEQFPQIAVANPPKFISYWVIALLAAVMQVSVPLKTGGFPISFLFLLIGLVEFRMPEVLLMAASLAFIDGLRQRPLSIRRAVSNQGIVMLALYAAWRVSNLITLEHPTGQSVLRYLTAAVILWILTAVPNSLLASGLPPYRGAGATLWRHYLPAFPYYFAGLVVAMLLHALNLVVEWQLSLVLLPFGYVLYRTYVLHHERVQDQTTHAEETASLHLRTIEALAMAIDAKDDTTADHLQRVRVYALELGKTLHLSEDEMKALHVAALLHDIGKLAVPEYIISKPGRLTPEEFEKMKIHPVVGAEIVDRVGFPYPVAPIVRAHHERWNGTGYPDGLKGEEIPIGARILAVVDALDALASDRQYRKALPLDAAMARIRQDSGVNFDPRVVEALSTRYEEFERKARAQDNLMSKLSRDIKTAGGNAPAAGFEKQGRTMLTGTLKSEAEAMLNSRASLERLIDNLRLLRPLLPVRELLRIVGANLHEDLPHDAMLVAIVDSRHLIPVFAAGPAAPLLNNLRVPLGQGLLGWVAENRMPIMNGNPAVEPGYSAESPLNIEPLLAALAVPLEYNGDVIGVIAVYRTQRDAFAKSHLNMLSSAALRIAPALLESLGQQHLGDPPVALPRTPALEARLHLLRADLEIGKGYRVVLARIRYFDRMAARVHATEVAEWAKRVAEAVRESLRSKDELYYAGPGEFVWLRLGPPPGDLEGELDQAAATFAEMTRYLLPDARLELGSAVAPDDGERLPDLLAAADRHLFLRSQGTRGRLETGRDFAPLRS